MLKNNKKIPKKFKQAIIDNPHWILEDLDMLDFLIKTETNKNNENIVDLRDIYFKKIKSQIENLTRKHNVTISAAYENFLSANSLHRCIIKILEQTSLEKFINILNKDIKEILQCSELILLFSGRNKLFLRSSNFLNVKKEEIQEIIKLSNLNDKQLSKLQNNSEKLYMNTLIKKSEPNVCSEAILSLCTHLKENNFAILILGSPNKRIFNNKIKTDYLNILAKIISIQLNSFIVNYTDEEKI